MNRYTCPSCRKVVKDLIMTDEKGLICISCAKKIGAQLKPSTKPGELKFSVSVEPAKGRAGNILYYRAYINVRKYTKFKHGGYGWAGMFGFPDSLDPDLHYSTKESAREAGRRAIETFKAKVAKDPSYKFCLKRNATGTWN